MTFETDSKTKGDLLCARPHHVVNMRHELAQLAGSLDWVWREGEMSPVCDDKSRPGIESRFVTGLLLLRHFFGWSARQVCEYRVDDPHLQYLIGEELFHHGDRAKTRR